MKKNRKMKKKYARVLLRIKISRDSKSVSDNNTSQSSNPFKHAFS